MAAGYAADMSALQPTKAVEEEKSNAPVVMPEFPGDQTLENLDPVCRPGSIFEGKTFLISPRVSDPAELAEMIGASGGKNLLVRPNLAERPPDYEVRRLCGLVDEPRSGAADPAQDAGRTGGGGGGFGRPKRQMSRSSLSCGGKVVSEYWVRKCIALGRLLDPEVCSPPLHLLVSRFVTILLVSKIA